jgi:hypothetical protein
MKTRSALAVCALALAVTAASSHAATVRVTDAGVGWTVTRSTSNGPGTYDAVSYTLDPTVNNLAAVVVNPINPAWTAQNDPRLGAVGAKWISADVTSGTGTNDPMFTKYVYKGSFTVSQASTLSLTFAADNFVDSLILSTGAGGTGTILDNWTNPTGTLGDLSTNGKIWGFKLENVQSKLSNGTGTIFITANTFNFDTALNQPYNPGPNGFIMAVDAAAVPLPAAVWGGLSLLGGLGLARRLRRK